MLNKFYCIEGEIMSGFIEEETQEFNLRNQDKVTLSVRLSVQEDLILQELADSWDTTRQDIITRLIQKYIVGEWKNKYKDDKQTETLSETEQPESANVSYFLLNTNSVNDVADHDFMMNNHYAAAFEDGYKEKIQRIKAGDYVFLYASGKGIVAYGVADGKVQKTHHYNVEDKTYFQKLNNFVDLKDNPIKARQVKAILGRSFPFAQTLSEIFDGDKILKFIDEMK